MLSYTCWTILCAKRAQELTADNTRHAWFLFSTGSQCLFYTIKIMVHELIIYSWLDSFAVRTVLFYFSIKSTTIILQEKKRRKYLHEQYESLRRDWWSRKGWLTVCATYRSFPHSRNQLPKIYHRKLMEKSQSKRVGRIFISLWNLLAPVVTATPFARLFSNQLTRFIIPLDTIYFQHSYPFTARAKSSHVLSFGSYTYTASL